MQPMRDCIREQSEEEEEEGGKVENEEGVLYVYRYIDCYIYVVYIFKYKQIRLGLILTLRGEISLTICITICITNYK